MSSMIKLHRIKHPIIGDLFRYGTRGQFGIYFTYCPRHYYICTKDVEILNIPFDSSNDATDYINLFLG